MSELIFEHPVFILGSLHCIIGLAAAIVAQQKGYSLNRWLLWGLIGGTLSLIIALSKPPCNSEDRVS